MVDYFIEWEDVEPGAFVTGGIKRDSHGILLQQRR